MEFKKNTKISAGFTRANTAACPNADKQVTRSVEILKVVLMAYGDNSRGSSISQPNFSVERQETGGMTVDLCFGGDDLYTELWMACAGPLVDVHRPEASKHFLFHIMVMFISSSGSHGASKHFLFHISARFLLEASTNQELNQCIPLFNLPSKILCHVVHIQLLAEQETNEVYAQITLQPESDQNEPRSPDPCPPEPPRPAVHSFRKILTASDTSTHGGFSVLRKHANECLPPLDLTQPIPTQELAAKDLHGYEWRFKHIFRGQPRRHLLTTGWSTFVTSKRLVAGGCLYISELPHPMPQQPKLSSSFTISRGQAFIINLNKYLEAVNNGFSVGMKFEGEDSPERRFTGTIVEVGDSSPQREDSKWRSLKDLWDEPASIQRPERVSPWEIEPFISSTPSNLTQPTALKNKKLRPSMDLPVLETTTSSAASAFWYPGSTQSHDLTQLTGAEVQSSESQVMWPPEHKEIQGNLIISGCGSSRIRPEGSWPSPLVNVSLNLFQDGTEDSKSPSMGLMLDLIEKGKKPETASGCQLFGIELINNPNTPAPTEKEPTHPICLISSTTEGLITGTLLGPDSDKKLDLLKAEKEQKEGLLQVSLKEFQSKQSCSTSTRSRTKVQMQGIVVGRAVDLTVLEGYDQLVNELEEMFDIKGELCPRNKWEVVFTDDEGDMMLMGDDPWPEFCKMVKRIFIYSSQEVKKMSPRSKVPASSLEGEGTIVNLDS
ncbi:hypothetical protein HHK36_020116 [Tetracentron sinense]|uniref:Auxin response factor n=1 Tax=Tetracentron sinense TaxID=13715 RepID=A0A834YUW4_TETSI|nr:hypothetical protein HHK36_020116 [Tetracentron sinense]